MSPRGRKYIGIRTACQHQEKTQNAVYINSTDKRVKQTKDVVAM